MQGVFSKYSNQATAQSARQKYCANIKFKIKLMNKLDK